MGRRKTAPMIASSQALALALDGEETPEEVGTTLILLAELWGWCRRRPCLMSARPEI